ncbi:MULTISPECIES: urease accessory protein UreF [Pseudonocardia]|uniref:Urease accessory protein UreF n=2 Tax=Pseudonocardia TaxID=1847 RepID=A0A1Y2N8M1_PSEAH|nr:MULTISPECIES: urease accessory UreF family protein [Pseudonocardia]OSY43268.1 Urease accessory protein UreF [Pseudonocardia autotrophica]TDN71756.1 urease accessory protein [Pseudonocardia autotrophica]BBG02443.1 urease accessory protein UreF [Pseudonocardia autotrophica]GEC23221.1 urease accessory protein UreF [Pseudonocardia saturnea]
MAGLASLVLADARFPGGGHVHSGGLEEAVARDLVSDVPSLGAFLRGRLRTAGRVAAAFAAAAVTLAQAPGAGPGRAPAGVAWDVLDAALDARTPSAAQRDASRAQGKASLRAARAAWPSPLLDTLVAVHPRPHHPLLLGAVIGHAGESPAAAARCAGYLAVSGPASAAVRLLGLDPFAVNSALVALDAELDAIVHEAAALAAGPVDELPAPGAPVLDLMAESHVRHHRERVRLFAS